MQIDLSLRTIVAGFVEWLWSVVTGTCINLDSAVLKITGPAST